MTGRRRDRGTLRARAGVSPDLRRLRLARLIRRLPHTDQYVLTDGSIRVAVFYTKAYNRLLVPLTAADQP